MEGKLYRFVTFGIKPENINIKEALLEEHSKAMCLKIVAAVISNNKFMIDLMNCFFDENKRLSQRAAYPMSYIASQQQDLILPYLNDLVNHLDQVKHDACIRNTLRIFNEIDIPENLEGKLYEKAYNYLHTPKLPVAIRAFAITTCTKIANKYPELTEELATSIELYLEGSKPAYQFRAKKALKTLRGN